MSGEKYRSTACVVLIFCSSGVPHSFVFMNGVRSAMVFVFFVPVYWARSGYVVSWSSATALFGFASLCMIAVFSVMIVLPDVFGAWRVWIFVIVFWWL